jgi:malate dehydrogenase (oxaloacetate-decarboxylating)(NADP+)
VVGKRIDQVKLVTSGAGAAAIACLDLLVNLGIRLENITVTDLAGVVYEGRVELMDPRKARYARPTAARSLGEVIDGADVFLGLSAPDVLKRDMVARMAPKPLILALANPRPEILPEDVRAVRDDAVIATGRSDYPNQVNNVLCFPFIFRGALDVGATAINEAMKVACVKAIADLSMAEPSEIVAKAYGDQPLTFGPEFLIPKPFDPRLIYEIAPAVAKAAMDSGVATRPIEDFAAYRERLVQFVFRSGLLMRPMFERAKQDLRRIVYAEGEDERVLRAVQQVIDERLAKPILIGRPDIIERRVDRLGLRMKDGVDVTFVNPDSDHRFNDYWRLYHSLMERKGVSPDTARRRVRTDNTIIGALMLKRGEADALLCGTAGRFKRHLDNVHDVIGQAPGVCCMAALNILILDHGTLFLCDTHVQLEPTADQIAEMAVMAGVEMRRFGVVPKVALLSHSSFGTSDHPSARKMKEALELLAKRAPELEADGEMQGDAALSEEIRKRVFPNARLTGQANLLIMPTLDAANIAFNILKALEQGQSIGPILLGTTQPAHILTPSVTVRGLVNMTAVAAVEAQVRGQPVKLAAPAARRGAKRAAAAR